MKAPQARALCVAGLAALLILPSLVSRFAAPANYGGHALTTGFGRGRLDLQGIVSEGGGASIDLPDEPAVLTLRLSGAGKVSARAKGAEAALVAADVPASLRLILASGGPVVIESASRVRLHEFVIERARTPWLEIGLLSGLGGLSVVFAVASVGSAISAAAALLSAFVIITRGSLSATIAHIAVARLLPALIAATVFLPAILALYLSLRHQRLRASRLTRIAFVLSLTLISIQMALFDPPLILGDPQAYFEMGGQFAASLSRLRSPLGLGPILSDLQPYLALPATGLLYGLLRFVNDGVWLIYAVQSLAMAGAVAAMVALCEHEFGPRVAKLALGLSCLHPTFWVLPGIVQPEPFILLAWTMAAHTALTAIRENQGARRFLAAGLLFGCGLALHPQGLSFLLVAVVLCLLPWARDLARRPGRVMATVLGIAAALLPVAAAEHFSRPLAYVLDKQYGFFAYTSTHPLGFWLYVDSDGWQGPLRIEDTTYQKELMAEKGKAAVSSSFADVASFLTRHPGPALNALLTNLHRLWQQPDNPFAVPFILPRALQPPLHRGLVVLFVLSLGQLLATRRALLVLPFVMLSMTYPAYHIFNKYATPALPFTLTGAAFALDWIWRHRSRVRPAVSGLTVAGVAALFPSEWAAGLELPGDAFLIAARGGLWLGLAVALAGMVRASGSEALTKALASAVGVVVLLLSSFAAARSDTSRGAWSAPLSKPFEATCRVPPRALGDPLLDAGAFKPIPLAWLMVDVESKGGEAPQIEVNGRLLGAAIPTMPRFGLATLRGHRRPEEFRQMWRAPLDEATLSQGLLAIKVLGDGGMRLFGDIRAGSDGPRLSVGQWPHVSVYRLMHEGQYRLPEFDAPPQACAATAFGGRPGIALLRIPAGEEMNLSMKMAPPPLWIF